MADSQTDHGGKDAPDPLEFHSRGRWPLPTRPILAIVGARRGTPYGEAVAERLAGDLARHGVIILSALVPGIAAAAHQGAIEADSGPIAVLGTGVDVIYLSALVPLADRILRVGGTLVSPFPDGTRPGAVRPPIFPGGRDRPSPMGRLIEYTLVSADGVFEDPTGVAGEFGDEAYLRDGLGLLAAADAALFGRRTYEAFAKLYAPGSERHWADRLDAIPKYVFSSTLERAEWSNSTVVRGEPAAEVARLKDQVAGDLVILGHGLLAETLLRARLTDVIDLTVYPRLLGRGKPFLRDGQDARLRLVAVKTFSKIVKLTYEPQY
jgi:dihydrofolate reductase